MSFGFGSSLHSKISLIVFRGMLDRTLYICMQQVHLSSFHGSEQQSHRSDCTGAQGVCVFAVLSQEKRGSNDAVQIDLILSGQAMSKRHLFH